MFSYYYGVLGHDVKNCAAHFAVTQNEDMVDYQYGEFLKAMGRRPKVDPQIEKQAGSENSSEDGGYKYKSEANLYRSEDGQYRSEASLQRIMAVTAKKRQCRNPSNDEEGVSVSSRNTLQSHECAKEELIHAGYVMRCIADVHNSSSDLKEISFLKDNGLTSGLDGKVNDSRVMGLSDSIELKGVSSGGLNVTKTKSSWTRFNMMGFGLGGLPKVLLPSIGKRHIPLDFEDKQNCQGEEVRVKRGKLDSVEATGVERAAGVDDHPCREQ